MLRSKAIHNVQSDEHCRSFYQELLYLVAKFPCLFRARPKDGDTTLQTVHN